jgi:predicted nuclease of predicted toxin-antitoxin system
LSVAVYLIDANLPRWFSLWASSDYVFAHEFAATWPDVQLWEYARSEKLVVVTKDADFRILALAEKSPPKLVHVRFGNMMMQEFFSVMTRRWPEVAALLPRYRLIEVWIDRVVAIS